MSRASQHGYTGLFAIDRRTWLARVASRGLFLGAVAGASSRAWATQEKNKTGAEESAHELERAKTRMGEATSHAIEVVTSEEYQAVGDASLRFMQTTTRDCEVIAEDFLAFYQAKGFQVKAPLRRMTIVAFLDDRNFREFARKVAGKLPPNVTGFYSRTENWLVLYDFRNLPELGGAQKNVRNLAHEASHQLSYNTGLLNRKGDVPVAIVEGLACFGEARRMHGHTEPGLLNTDRLSDLAHLQRRSQWIKIVDLLSDDSPATGRNVDRMQLFYAQSWLLIFTLMNSKERLPQFQAYLKTIFPRVDKRNRLEDATQCFGNLDQLDQELRRAAIRLQSENPL